MSRTFSVQIRDGLPADLDDCLLLDHSGETETVWQMTLQNAASGWQIAFRTERLPRPVDFAYPADRDRLAAVLAGQGCFLVARGKEEPELVGYLSMRIDPLYGNALVHDLVVSRPFRRSGIGARLLGVARRWALEHQALRLLAEVHTRNYPGIQFCQAAGLSFCGFNDQYFPRHEIAVFFGQSLRAS
jgi:GNAT superfamily N-acetyltransferase